MSSSNLEADAKAAPWWEAFQRVRERERFFHWDLEFPEVLADGGFDCVLGNPPWEKVKPDRKEFYGRVDVLIRAYTGGELDARIRELEAAHPDLAGEFAAYSERLKTLASCLKGGGDYRYVDWEIDGRSTGGDPDLFKFFLERAQQVLKPGGRLGYLVPSALYNNEGCTGLRHLLLEAMTIERFYSFENRKKIFNIHSSYKFVCLVAEKTATPAAEAEFRAAFMRHDLDELDTGPPVGVEVLIKRTDLERLSPGTLAFLEYRSDRDRELVLKMYGLLPGQMPRPLLGDQGPGTWNARFYTEFHMTNDRDLWTDPRTSRLYNPRQILGPVPGTTDQPPYYDPAAWPDIRAAMAEKGFWPLYEGKQIEQFVVDFKPVERWVHLGAAEKKYGKPPDPGPKLVFRDIARNTDMRTCIAAVLPERSCSGHTLTTLDVTGTTAERAATILNSFAFDCLVRLRTAGTHLSASFLNRVAVPSRADYQAIPAIPTRSADSGTDWTRNAKYLDAIWQANKAVAQAYGLTPDDFAHILSSFPVFARKRPAFYAYLLERVKEWKKEVGVVARQGYSVQETRISPSQAAEGTGRYRTSRGSPE